MKKVFVIALLALLSSPVLAATIADMTPGIIWNNYHSPSAESTKAIVTTATNVTVRSACYTNQTTTGLTLMIFASTSVPADGTVTPIDCIGVPAAAASGTLTTCKDEEPMLYSPSGLSVAVSTGASCFTKTTPSASGFFQVKFK